MLGFPVGKRAPAMDNAAQIGVCDMGIWEKLFGPPLPQITPAGAYARLQETNPPLIIDVRQPVETKSGSVPGAVLVPLTELGRRMAELPPDQEILCICFSGHRSPVAARRLARAGYQVINVTGGITAWQKAGLPLDAPV